MPIPLADGAPGPEPLNPVWLAARDNARWCDVVCRTHGAATTFHADAWVTATRSPPGYPDAVTLSDHVAADRLLSRIDSSPGCSVKDSFAALDLTGHGFEVLFEAEWVHRPAAPAGRAGLAWEPVHTVDQLRVWAAAHGGGAVFRPGLLDDPAVAVLSATDAGGAVVAGVIGTCTGAVAGLSNLFTVSADPDQVWQWAVAALSASFPGRPLVGYEHGDDLAAAHRAGFASTGRLRVWLALDSDPRPAPGPQAG